MKKFAVVLLLLISALTAWPVQADAGNSYMPSGTAKSSNTFVFGPHPYSNPQDIFEDYDPIMRYLEHKIPGVRFQIEASKNYEDYESKLAARHFHFALPNPYQTVLSLKYGYQVIAKMTPDDDFRGVLVSRSDKNIHNASQLTGKTVCFPSETAVAATMLPMLYLHNQLKKNPQNLMQIRYVGSQISSMLNAYSGEADACGTSTRFWRAWSRENPVKAKDMHVIFTTRAVPHNAFIALDNIDAGLARKVADALVAMDKDADLDQRQFKKDQQHFEPASNRTYKPIQEFMLQYDRAIGLPDSMKNQHQP